MKHSKYIMMGVWDEPMNILARFPIRWDMQGRPTKFDWRPSYIAHHKALTPEGFVVCSRKFTPEEGENN